jgi:signal transduction histidine kinase/CheY-like chemotaxis protein
MSVAIRSRIIFEQRATAKRLRQLAIERNLVIDGIYDLQDTGALEHLEPVTMLIMEESAAIDVVAARVYSIARANPDLLIVVLLTQRRPQPERLLRAGAFDVLVDGAHLASALDRTLAAATRVAALQAERSQLTSELAHQDKLSALGVLAAGVSHEINNPCAAILSNINVIRDQLEVLVSRPRFHRADALDQVASDWIEALGDCVNAANRIHQIVKTLNVFSRKSDSAQPVLIDLNEEVRTVMRLIGKEVRFQAEFATNLSAELPPVAAPPNSITQIVTNLVVNALQALEGSGVAAPRIYISTDFDENHVMLEVGDNGPGIPPEVVDRIFDPFFTTKPVGKGTGLGLSITQQLVQKMGGEIFVDSDLGAGARFSVLLQRSQVQTSVPSGEHWTPPASERLRVLLLDDDDLILRSMQRSLSTHFECQAIDDPRAALTLLGSDGDFDAVVSDVVMPDMNGLEFWNELGRLHADLALRTVFISGGITSERLRVRVSDTGRPCLSKPLDMTELIRTIRRVGRPFEDMHR